VPMALEITKGPRKGKTFQLDDTCVVLVGRSHHCHCRLGPDPRSSRVHLVMEVAAPHCRLRDLGSTNGTFVNGKRVIEAAVGDGDTITVGQTELLVKATAPAPRPAPAQDPAKPSRLAHEDRPPPLGLEARPAAPAPSPQEQPDEETSPITPCLRCGQPGSAPEDRLPGDGRVCPDCLSAMQLQGENVPGYRLVHPLEAGGMSLLWVAEDTGTGERVVVKNMSPELAASQRAVRMFHRESQISLDLRHPNIVSFIKAGQYEGRLYIVMEYIDGVDAERLCLQRGGRLPAPEVVAIGACVLDALDYAHRRNIVHRDVKPSNILVRGEFPNHEVKVTDFGIARVYGAAASSDITRRKDVRGSIPFMPPEQVLNCRGVDHRADIFALGATLYHLLTGQYCRDFNVRKKAAMLTVIDDEIVPLQRRAVDVPPALAQVIHRALSREPAERFQTAADMNQALQQAMK